MAGRPSKPTELILLEHKSHRTKAEIEHRKAAEKALYTGETFAESPQVKADSVAHQEFTRLKRLYTKINCIDALDQQVINRYCLEVSNVYALQNIFTQLNALRGETDDFTQKISIYEQINKTNTAMQKCKELLLKYEDRLFLNPMSRIKSIPKTPEEPKTLSPMAEYLKKRAEGSGRQG